MGAMTAGDVPNRGVSHHLRRTPAMSGITVDQFVTMILAALAILANFAHSE